ncbi:RcpC/CpaB family pilus assembly protein [Paractinoplanes atraurantiacus]|uniref:Pilus assembly protein CpaB n=1 Tax=Paractinoplanes atraurantiacus TaxID=1036182 RepID=A0A285I444_9ACTN|nr:RcpC/CpaB family pilus assembly protein [Actinoplanes atraurantiacus]SNY41836.1 pilus assembly protein CpaB [Actinoplanes atraurantiacus]
MRRRVLILLAALLLAGISGVAILAYAHSADRRALNGMKGVWVLVAKQRIPAGTKGADIRAKGWAERVLMPARTVPEGTLTSWTSDLDRLTLSATAERKQLLMRPLFQSIAPSASASSRGFVVPKGMLAVTVELSVPTQVAGNLIAGDRVAVYGTFPATAQNAEDQTTRLLLPRAVVISIGEALAPAITSGPTPTPAPSASVSPSASATVAGSSQATYVRYVATLAVDSEDAQRLVHAARTGLLYLAMLGPEATAVPGPGVDISRLFP